MIEFIEYYSATQTTPFTFEIDGTLSQATRYVHRMRVELSRMRQLVKNRGRAPIPFKMILMDIQQQPIFPPRSIITLERSYAGQHIAKEINAIFDQLSDGEQIR